MLHFLKRFLTLPVIIGPLPNQIVAGQFISALPVMQNFQWIVDQVNANIASSIPTNVASIPTFVPSGSVGGTANAITLTPNPALSAYAAGNRFSFPASGPNTGAVTVNVSGLGVKSLVYADATALSGAELLAGGLYDIEYNGTNFVLMNSSQGSAIVSWTPTLTFGGGSTGMAYTTQTGKAWKTGRMVYFAFNIVLSAKGSSTGVLRVNGLPYTIAAGWEGNAPGPAYCFNVTFGSGYLIHFFILGTTTTGMANVQSGIPALELSDTQIANNSQIAGSGFYVAAT